MLPIEQSYGVVVAIKEEEYKFLIVLQNKKIMNWGFPKGRSENGESSIETAIRELKEETNISNIKILDFSPIREIYEIKEGHRPCMKVIEYFVGIVKDKSVIPQETEVFEYIWAPYLEAMDTFVYQKETRRKVLKQANEYLKKV